MIYQAQWKTWGWIRWRGLSWAEHKRFEQQMVYKSPIETANAIYRACVISGPKIEESDITPGVIITIANTVFNNSAFSGEFNTLSYKLNQAREIVSNDFLLAARAIIAGLFKYTFEDIDSWDEETFLLRLAQAEFVAGKPLQLASADDSTKEKRQKQDESTNRKVVSLSDAQKKVITRVNGG